MENAGFVLTVADPGDAFGNRRETALQGDKEQGACLGQFHPAIAAQEEGLGQLLLQCLDPMADCGGRHIELGRCVLEAQVPGCRLKAGEVSKGGQVIGSGHERLPSVGCAWQGNWVLALADLN